YVSDKHTWGSRSPFCCSHSYISERTIHPLQGTFLQREFVHRSHHWGSFIWCGYYLSFQSRIYGKYIEKYINHSCVTHRFYCEQNASAVYMDYDVDTYCLDTHFSLVYANAVCRTNHFLSNGIVKSI